MAAAKLEMEKKVAEDKVKVEAEKKAAEDAKNTAKIAADEAKKKANGDSKSAA